MKAPTLRPYQEAALNAISAAFAAGTNRVLVKKPTGTGKTVMFAALLKWPPIATWLSTFAATDRRMLVIAHREELLDQAAEKIRAQNPTLQVSIEQGDRVANRFADVIIASIQTLSAGKFRRLERLLSAGRFRVVIVDEAHHAAATTYRGALARLGFLPEVKDTKTDIESLDPELDATALEASLKTWDETCAKDQLLVGVTATPNRSDAIGLGCVFQSIPYSYALKDAIDDKWLVPITSWAIETATSLDDVRTTRGEFVQSDLADAVNNDQRNSLAIAAWREHAEHRSTLAFTVDVEHARCLSEAFLAAGVPAAMVSGETPKEERRQILQDFTDGRLEVVCNCMVLTEGTDLPRASCILHAKPTKSATLYEQMTGRGLRLFPGKDDCVVIDLVDLSRRHSLQNSPVLFGLPPGLITKGLNLKKLEEELEALRKAFPRFDVDQALEGAHLTLEQLRARAEAVDVWAVPALGAFGTGRTMNWIKTGAERYELQYPWGEATELLQVQKDLLGHWEIALTLIPKDRTQPKRQRTLATGLLEAGAAAGVAEAFVLQERRTAARLKDREAPWRSRPASEKQLAVLRKVRAPYSKGITMGEASDLIDLHMSRKRRA